MTKEQVNEFLKSVKGRQIKLNYWPEGRYIIPTGEWGDTSDDSPHYWIFWCIDEKGEKCWWRVYNGFKGDKQGDKWVFVETFEDYLEMYHND